MVDGRLLADGGILDPLPMAPVAAVNADLTIAVSLAGSESAGAEPDPEPDSGSKSRSTTEWLNRMLRSTTALMDTVVPSRSSASAEPEGAQVEAGTEPDEPEEPDVPEVPRLGSFEVMNRTIDIAQAALARHTLAAYPPDLLIEVPRTVCRSLDFHRAAEVIDVGRQLAARALDG